ncbi:DNA gyrase subunit B [Streptomyces bambusae]|uniref:DNA gyrase subunit B n=1 Tax=Streptomyces bambusae TaxID=1550616 RepID=UPI001CFE8205|nr:DNA gyrase subunit B [Streptomyces bambusae]MCB5166470.1 DNA gyrase subunit B [Streptomyces bambusae]
MSEDRAGYDATHIELLGEAEAVRLRPGMWLGSVGERGLHQAVFGVVEWAVNEVLGGRGERLAVTLHGGGSVRVAVSGASGVPCADDGTGLEELLTSHHPGARRCDRRRVGVGVFGNGPFLTNALSSRLTAEVRRGGTGWVRTFERGVAVGERAPVTGTDGGGDATVIDFRPDGDIFETVVCSYDALAERFRELAFLYGGLDLTLTDARRPDAPRSNRFHFPAGAADFVAFLAGTATAPAPFHFVHDDPRMNGSVEVALKWRHAPGGDHIRTFVNGWATTDGGAHLTGFHEGLRTAVAALADEHRFTPAVTAVVSVKLDHPDLTGATRRTLSGPAVHTCVADAVAEHLRSWDGPGQDQGRGQRDA